MPRTVPTLPGTSRRRRPIHGGIAPASRDAAGGSPTWVRLHAAHFGGSTIPSQGCLAAFHQFTRAAHVAEAGQMKGRNHADPELPRRPQLRQSDAGLDAVDVENVRPLGGEPRDEVLAAAHRDAVVCLVARRLTGDRIAEHADAAVVVLVGRGARRIGRRDAHLVSGILQSPAQPLDVDLGSADAVGKVPAEQRARSSCAVTACAGPANGDEERRRSPATSGRGVPASADTRGRPA